MTKVRIIRLYEYTIDPKNYPGCSTDEERMEVDRTQSEEGGYQDIGETATCVNETWELIK